MFSAAVRQMINSEVSIAIKESHQDGYDGACELLMKSFTLLKDASFTGAQVAEIILEAKGYQIFPEDKEVI
jgi:hypothetical protein